MNRLESYIFGRALRMCLGALVPVLAIIWTTQVLGRINLVTDSGQSMGSFFLLATYLLPTIIPVVLPFAIAIGATVTLRGMNTDSELAVIDAAGAPRKTIYRPVLILASLACVVSFSVDNFVEPVSRLGMRKIIAATYADLLSSVIQEKAFRQIDDGLFVQISERGHGRTLKGLFVADLRDPQFEMIYYAREGAVDANGGTLIMQDGEIHRKDNKGDISVIHFDSYSFDLSELSETKGQAKLRASDRGIGFLLAPDRSDPDFQRKPENFRAELHRRLTDWFFPITFALASLAVAGSAHSNRDARLHPLLPVLVFAFAFRWGAFFLADRIETGAGSPAVLYAFVYGTSLLLVVLLYRNSSRLGRRGVYGRFSEACMAGIARAWASRRKNGEMV